MRNSTLSVLACWTLACLVGLAALAGCTPRPPSPLNDPRFDVPRVNLPTISDENPDEPQLAYVLLRPQTNYVRFINTPADPSRVLARIEVYRRDAEADSAELRGTVTFPPPPDFGSVTTVFTDAEDSGLTSRYEFRAYTAAGERVPLPVLYATTDERYAAELNRR